MHDLKKKTTYKEMCMDEQHGIYVQPENKAETPEIHHTSRSA